MVKGEKTALILKLVSKGIPRAAIAAKASCKPNYVSQICWRQRHKDYHAAWMRKKREDPAYSAKELAVQRARAKHA